MSKETAKFVVQRDGVDYGVTGFNIQVDCQEGDLFYVQRGDTVYKWPRKFQDKDWEAQDFWFHIKNLTEEVFVWPRDEEDHFIWDKNTEQKVERMLPGGEYIIGGYNDEGHPIRFEGNSGSWDFGELTDPSLLSEGSRFFADCPNFNGDVSPLKSVRWKNIDEMFYKCRSFNQDISDWDITHVYNQFEIKDFLLNAAAFTGDLSGWCMHTAIGFPSSQYWCNGSGIYGDSSKHPQWNCRDHINNPIVVSATANPDVRAGTYNKLQPGDLFSATDTDGITYKVPFADIADILVEFESVLHIKNIRDGTVKIQDHTAITDMAGTVLNTGTAVEYTSGEYLVYGERAKLKSSTGNWDFGDQTSTQKRKGFGDFLYGCEKFNGNIQFLKVDSAQDLSYMFNKCSAFNQPVTHFRTPRVNTFRAMFQNCSVFNQPINHFDTSSAENMMLMFQLCSEFNQPVNNFNTSECLTMNSMFASCDKFNQDVSTWDVSKVENFRRMFSKTKAFNQPLDNWDVSKATEFMEMFGQSTAFDQPLNSWDVSSGEDFESMFWETPFNQPIGNWNTKSAKNMKYMFYDAKSFNQDISEWCVKSATHNGFNTGADALEKKYRPCWGHCPRGEDGTVDPCPIPWEGKAGIYHVIVNNPADIVVNNDLVSIYNKDTQEPVSSIDAPGEWIITGTLTTFQGSPGNWDFGPLTDTSQVGSMNKMFYLCPLFNSDISNWDVSNVSDMSYMFGSAEVFNSDISKWNTGNVKLMQNMFYRAPLFDSDISSWDVSQVTNMYRMFYNTEYFNQDISSWDVSKVTNMGNMLYIAKAFNQDLTGWCVSSIDSEPSNFNTGSLMPEDGSKDPVWGTCPRGEDQP